MLDEVNIGAILNEEGNIVQAVLLKCGGVVSGSVIDTVNTTDDAGANKDNTENIIEQISVDTCPQRRMVDEILGGNGITFIGQYEDEGIVVVASKQQQQRADGTISSADQIINPHRLKPPLHNETILGDILLLKVRQGEEEEDQSNPFFQDYTKEDYAAFTNTSSSEEMQEEKAPSEKEEECLTTGSSDIDDDSSTSSSSSKEEDDDEEEGEEENDGSEESEEANDDDDDDDGDYIEDVSDSAMFNLVMGTVLRQYQESNGRGPNTEELLCIRQTVAEKMGIVLDSTTDTTTNLTTNSDSPTDKHKHSNDTEEIKLPLFSSKASENPSCCSPVKKRVKFATEE